MPERGGPTTQSGILYQNSIAALFLGRLLDTTQRPENERVVHVRVETPDAVDDIVITFADNHKVFIQAKEDIAATDTAWKNLWEDFDNQYQRGEFVKGIDKLALWVGSYRVEHAGLAEVCQRAISSETYDAWMSRITKEQKETLDKVKPLLRPELLEEATLLSFFKSLEVEIHAFKSVERDESVYWMPATNLYPKVLFRLLRDRVGGFARVRGEFTAYPLLNLLVSENPDLIFSKPTDFLELKRVIQSASSTLRHHKNTIGNTGLHIERCVVTEMVDWIINSNDDSKNLAMLVDQAGTGKTVALQDVQIALEAKGIDVLAIKADQQLSGICHLSDIDEKLGLAHPPEQILSRLAKAGRVVVLIDQIDALSLSLAHDQSTLDVVLDFIARLRRIPNLRILVSCRLFDRNSDHRIKEVDLSQQFALTNFTEGEISQVLNLVGKTFQDLQKPTQALLQIPLHLHLFALLLDNNTSSERLLGISNLQELYGAIWENIVLKDDPKSLSSKAGRVEVLRFIKNYMAQYQVTAVPQSALIQSNMVHLEPDIKWLASTGIIITGNQKWTFIHQTFFDYCFAREFVDQGENLANHVLRSEQGLFIRPLLTQVIAYMRGTDSPQYLRELKNLLYTQGIRFHLYDLLLRWFGSLQSPTDGEWLIAQRMLINQEARMRLLQSMFGNPGWFARLQNSLLPTWLIDNDSVNDTVLLYLVSMFELKTTQTSVVNLLTPFIGKSVEWDKHLWRIVSMNRKWWAVEAVEFFEQVTYQNSNINQQDIHQIGLVAKSYPRTGVRLLRFILDLALRHHDEKVTRWKEAEGNQDDSRPFALSFYEELHRIEDHDIEDAFEVVSKSEPLYYLEMILPWLDNALARRDIPNNLPLDYYLWDDFSSNWYNDGHGIIPTFIFSLVDAVVSIAQSNPETCDTILNHLSQSPFRTPHLILTRIFVAIPDMCSSRALSYILADRRRLELGYADNYDSRKLVQAIYPYLNASDRSSLEEFILQPPIIRKDRGLKGLQWRGIEQYYMLLSIPREYLSKRALSRLSEWERKFPNLRPTDDPITVKFGWIGSPIPTETALKMTDKQWLKALKKYHGAVEHRNFLKGGARQLSTILQTLVKENPQRYFQLLHKVSDEVDDAYVQAFINGFAEAEAPVEWLFYTIQRFSKDQDRNIKRTVARAIEKRTKESIPDDIVELLMGYLYEDSSEDEWWWARGENHRDVYSSFLNSDRGAAFSALMRIYDKQNCDDANSKKWGLIEFVATDSSTALHIGAIHELTYMLRHDNKRAINLFEKLLQGHEILLESNHTGHFIYWALYKNFLKLQPYIIAMMHHKKTDVQERGAQLACIAGISDTAMESEEALLAAQELAEKTTSFTAPLPWKRGAAIVYTNNVTGKPQDDCVVKLIELLKEEDEAIHDSIGRIFYSLREEHIYTLREFIEKYARLSKQGNHKFTEFLLDYGLLDPEWVLFIISIILTEKDLLERDPWSIGVEEIIRLVLRVYADPTISEHTRSRSMDLFDILMDKSPAFSQKVLSEWDQR